MISLKCPQGFQLSSRFFVASKVAQPAIDRRVAHFAARLETRIKAKASGRPGPRAPHGDYRRSIGRQAVHYFGYTGFLVGTNAPQGPRLEFGFVGVDAIGRHYNQPPYPHFGPALDDLTPEIIKGLDGVVNGLVRIVVA